MDLPSRTTIFRALQVERTPQGSLSLTNEELLVERTGSGRLRPWRPQNIEVGEGIEVIETFQPRRLFSDEADNNVHQTKKSNKFSCKMCGEKQSIKRHYGLGTGQECRLQVQKLNGLRGEMDEINENLQLNDDSEEELNEHPSKKITLSKGKSKWSNFIDEDNEINEPKPDQPMYLGATEVVLEVPKKVKRFVKPKQANKSNEVIQQNDYYSGNKTPWSKPWPNKNEMTKTDSYYVKHSMNESTEVLNTQKDNINDFKRKLSEEKIIHDIPKPKIKKVFQPSKVSKQSKWAQFTENDDGVENDEHIRVNDNTEVEHNEYTGVNSNYEVEKDEDLEENDDHRVENYEICFNSDVKTNAISQNEHHSQESEEIPKSLTQLDKTNVKTNIFSTCDESELDSILDV